MAMEPAIKDLRFVFWNQNKLTSCQRNDFGRAAGTLLAPNLKD